MKHVIDAKNKYLGRLATEIALILQGKKKVGYNPRILGDDKVLVTNAGEIKVSGRKKTQKIYYHHTGYMGHLRSLTYEQVVAKDPTHALRHAVRGMLPKNFLRDKRLRRLTIVK